jgi:NADH-quinone oxidoreductase subunit G
MNNRKLFNDKEELESSMLNYLSLQKEKQEGNSDSNIEIDEKEFKNEKLEVNIKDYYFSNVIARSSKTMIECNNSKINLKSTGTEG